MDERESLHKFPLTASPTGTVGDVGVVGFTNSKDNNSIPTSLIERQREKARNKALAMLRDRNIDGAEELVDASDPQVIVETCEWWDRRDGVKPGLLVWKIRQGGIGEPPPASKTQRLRDMFERYVTAHPVGSRLCSHAALAARRWPDDEEGCVGQLMVTAAAYPVLEMACSSCGFYATLTPRMMKAAA